MQKKHGKNKAIVYSILFVVFITIITIGIIMYGQKINKEVQNSTMSLEEMASILDDTDEETEVANSGIGKDIGTVEEELSNVEIKTEEIQIEEVQEETIEPEVVQEVETNTNIEVEKVEEKVVEVKKELEFEMPVIGELLRGFAKESLIYSETLEEWVTHLGIDIIADKTTVVKSAEAGVIKTIKNDPRYGLTVVVEHDEEYQTVYSNLLTAEFVVEGEKIEKGQSLGTVGNSAAFEIADEPHLHFEVLKNNEAIDPMTVLKE